jgi:hypothetical protein
MLQSLAIGLGLVFLAGAADTALAQCCAPPPPPCCVPPPPPPSNPPCCTPGHNVNIPGVNVFVAPSVVVNASASARASASAGGQSMVYFSNGGYVGNSYTPPMSSGPSALNVVGGLKKRVAYQATRSMSKRVVIRAVCMDAREVPHAASQVSPDREIDEAFEGELYRCLAGTRLVATWSEYVGKVDFEGGKTIACQKGDALYKVGGKVECRKQKPARDCNERSLLRRFGAGIKILTMTWTETYTAYREEEEQVESASSMSFDGGVGGVVY